MRIIGEALERWIRQEKQRPAKCTTIEAPASFFNLARRTAVVGDKAYDADWIRGQIQAQGAIANIPNKRSRVHCHRFNRSPYRERNLIERFFNRIKYSRRVATYYEKLGISCP